MKCHDCKCLMLECVKGTLSSATRADFEKHLLECPTCFDAWERFRNGKVSEASSGLFWYLMKPSGGFKRLFLLSSLCIIVFFMALVAVYFKIPFFIRF